MKHIVQWHAVSILSAQTNHSFVGPRGLLRIPSFHEMRSDVDVKDMFLRFDSDDVGVRSTETLGTHFDLERDGNARCNGPHFVIRLDVDWVFRIRLRCDRQMKPRLTVPVIGDGRGEPINVSDSESTKIKRSGLNEHCRNSRLLRRHRAVECRGSSNSPFHRGLAFNIFPVQFPLRNGSGIFLEIVDGDEMLSSSPQIIHSRRSLRGLRRTATAMAQAPRQQITIGRRHRFCSEIGTAIDAMICMVIAAGIAVDGDISCIAIPIIVDSHRGRHRRHFRHRISFDDELFLEIDVKFVEFRGHKTDSTVDQNGAFRRDITPILSVQFQSDRTQQTVQMLGDIDIDAISARIR